MHAIAKSALRQEAAIIPPQCWQDEVLDQPRGLPDAVLVVFPGQHHAERLVAGVPAAARVAREVALAGFPACSIITDAAWVANAHLPAEFARLAGGLKVEFATVDGVAQHQGSRKVLVLDGARLPAAPAITGLIDGVVESGFIGAVVAGDEVPAACARVLDGKASALARLNAAGRAILRATAKPGDGIVSRSINRPISRAISSVLLRFSGVRPIHATFGTAALALAMIVALTSGTRSGQIWGALLFQAASIVDGVDGEIARATFHTSRSGAMIDSVIDALTNLAFIMGLALNLALQGDFRSAGVGFAGLCVLAVGLAMIGRISARSSAPFTFDVIKDHYRSSSAGPPSRLMLAATFITSRDFFALAFVVMILAGLPGVILELFALSALLWLIAVVRAITAPRL